jgi:hypothetical protein
MQSTAMGVGFVGIGGAAVAFSLYRFSRLR